MLDLTNAIEEINYYKGSEKKKTLVYEGKKYLVKFPDPIREKGKNIISEKSLSIFSRRKNRYLCWSGKAFSRFFYNFARGKAHSVHLTDGLQLPSLTLFHF